VSVPKETLTQLIGLLEPLTSDERQRIVDSALVFLGQAPRNASPSGAERAAELEMNSGKELPARATIWMKQNGISAEQIESAFHMAGGVAELIAEVPGASFREKTLNVYLLAGLGMLLSQGDPSFPDEHARKMCEAAGCYSAGNHANYLKEKGNGLAGDKAKGWSLTGPGLKQVAELVKEMSAPSK
jgi:hypothetical protein